MDSFTPTVVGREIAAVGFSFYAPDEIRAMSVTAVYNPGALLVPLATHAQAILVTLTWECPSIIRFCLAQCFGF